MDAYLQVSRKRGAAGIDGQRIEDFEIDLKGNLYKLWNRMSSGTYFPKAVKRVDIPKKNGGIRSLGIPTVEDRIAQMIARNVFEPVLDPIFVDDSYGFRPNKSAHKALSKARTRCWKYDWVIDMDIKSFFDEIDHNLLLKAVDFHSPPKWGRLYIERWLKASVVDKDGNESSRDRGTPQGGVISPLLANLFLHYTFDLWMKRNYENIPFERYADDVILHCRSREGAEKLLREITSRFKECKLTIHPEKTKIVYCKDNNRTKLYKCTEFDFLGYTFKSRYTKTRKGNFFMNFTPAISNNAEKRIKDEIRKWRVHSRSDLDIFFIAKKLNPKLRGWYNYYGRFRPSEMARIYKMFQRTLVKWAKRKYKRLKKYWYLAVQFMLNIKGNCPNLFIHWKLGY